ncbi:MAG: ACT domain-containing protein [Peptococcaceae bacterium]|nr:ACT domain-containing protein [Peptococcaceae bacterium]
MPEKDRFYLVQEDILPESILKTVRAKEMLANGEAATVNEAVEKANLSRSAFYKYRDRVFPLQDGIAGKDVTIYLSLNHRTGVLSRVLAAIAARHGNIITINQSMPDRGLARVRIYLDIANLTGDMETLLREIKKVDGVQSVSLQQGNHPNPQF